VQHTIRLYDLLKKAQSNENFSVYEKAILKRQQEYVDQTLTLYHSRLERMEIHCHLREPEDMVEVQEFLSNLKELEKAITVAMQANKDFRSLFQETTFLNLYDRGVFILSSSQSIQYLLQRITSLPTSKRLYVSKELIEQPLRIFETTTKKQFQELQTRSLDSTSIHNINAAVLTPKTLETRLKQGIDVLMTNNSPFIMSYEMLSQSLLSFAQSVQRREGLANQGRRLLYRSVSIFTVILSHLLFGVALFWVFNPLSTVYPLEPVVEFFSLTTFFNFFVYPISFFGLTLCLYYGFRFVKVTFVNSFLDYLIPIGLVPILLMVFGSIAATRPAVNSWNLLPMWLFIGFLILYSVFETAILLVRKNRNTPRITNQNDTEQNIIIRQLNRLTDNVMQLLFLLIGIPMTLFVSRVDGLTYLYMVSATVIPLIIVAVMQFGYYQRQRILLGE
jgi:hypothetical protein